LFFDGGPRDSVGMLPSRWSESYTVTANSLPYSTYCDASACRNVFTPRVTGLTGQPLVETWGSAEVRVARRFSQEPAMSLSVITALRLMRSSHCRRECRSAALVLGSRQWSVADSLCHGDFSVGQFPFKLEAIDDSVGRGH